MHCKPFIGGGQHVITEPPEFDGTNYDALNIYEINDEYLIYIISQAKQPPLLNVKMAKKSDGDAMHMTSDYIYNYIISSIIELSFNKIMLYLIVVS